MSGAKVTQSPHPRVSASPLIVAHRGVSFYAPENTTAAIKMAIDIAAEGVEFDVRLSSDGIPVVFHDDTLVRTGRQKRRVADMTLDELTSVDVGSWFNSKYAKRSRPEFARETIPTLQQTLKLLHHFDGRIYVELKCNDADFCGLAREVVEVIKNHPTKAEIILKSFKLAAIPELRHLLPSVKTAALFAPEIMHFIRRREHIIALAHEFGADELSVHHSLITRRLCGLASDAAMPLTVWTVDDPKWLTRRKAFPIHALITNDPMRLLKARAREQTRS